MGKKGMKISIITPTNNPVYMRELERSILAQTYSNWEWIVLLNGGAKWDASNTDAWNENKIKIVECPFTSNSVGFLKKLACMQASGEMIAEVDHDDLLTPDCLAKLAVAFEDKEVGFVFSQNAKLSDNFRPYMPEYGWTSKRFMWNGRSLWAMNNQPVLPGRLAHIWFAPDHIRAWRKSVYEQVGGHDDSLRVCDDLDLMHRLYMVTRFKEIEEVLYVYRITGDNTYVKNGATIRELNEKLYDKNIVGLCRRYAELNGLQVVDLAGCRDRWASVLELVGDGCAGVIIADDVLQFVDDKVKFMREAHRALAVGGVLLAEVPSSEGREAFADPEVRSFWNENSFWHWTRESYARRSGNKVLFRECKLSTGFRETGFVSTTGEDVRVAYVSAHLEKRA
jgi:O-antigen biosynthesis protein